MAKFSRRPLLPLTVLLLVTCAIYFVTNKDTSSLGVSFPLPGLAEKPAPPPPEKMPGLDKDKPPMMEEKEEAKDEEKEQEKEQEEEQEKEMKEKEMKEKEEKEQEAQDEDKEEDREDEEDKAEEKKEAAKEEKPAKKVTKTKVKAKGTKKPAKIVGNGLKEYTETPFMPQMTNATLKAKLGNSAWHLLHTVLARYPDKPTKEEQTSLKQYVYFFAQTYPCGDCARHFQKLLKANPVQVSSRTNAAMWGCNIHNKVNERLKKPEYDCTKILEDYDCGCGDDEKKDDFTLGNDSIEHLRQVKVDEKAERQSG